MNTEDDGNKGIRILSLGEHLARVVGPSHSILTDNGGPGAYSQLLILKEYMARFARDSDLDECDLYPADYFELMGGVGFGGYVHLVPFFHCLSRLSDLLLSYLEASK